ncbi:hypothetical protein BJ742DRAFT_773681 [Cladochytrium replicatum]|nr:hypothetical protein BJ742DRAFT_773681 [Cladochytrium replicatum]
MKALLITLLIVALARSVPVDDLDVLPVDANLTDPTWDDSVLDAARNSNSRTTSCKLRCPSGYACVLSPVYDEQNCPYCSNKPFPYCARKYEFCTLCVPSGCTKKCPGGNACVAAVPSKRVPLFVIPLLAKIALVSATMGYKAVLIDDSCKQRCRYNYRNPCDSCRFWTCVTADDNFWSDRSYEGPDDEARSDATAPAESSP